MRRDCANTNAHYATQAIGMLGHDKENATWVVTKKATNTEDGTKELRCGRGCGEVLDTAVIPQAGITLNAEALNYTGKALAINPSKEGYESVAITQGKNTVKEAIYGGEYTFEYTYAETEEYEEIKVSNKLTISQPSSKKKRNKTTKIEDQDIAQGLDFEYIDLPKNLETPSDWAKDDVYDLTAKGIVNGYEDMTYRPNNLIRRDEFSKLAYLVLSLKEDENGKSKDFEDTKGNWAEEMIRVATTVDVLRGYDDTFFGPADNITNEQMMAILVRGLKYLGKDLRIDNDEDAENALTAVVDGANVSEWAKYDAATAVKYGLFIGNENKEIKPLGFTTRAQVAVILERYMNLVADLLK